MDTDLVRGFSDFVVVFTLLLESLHGTLRRTPGPQGPHANPQKGKFTLCSHGARAAERMISAL